MQSPELQRRNRRTLAASLAVVAAMVGLSFASVPLYRVFCQVTGFGGTPQRVAQLSDTVGERTMTIRFTADLSPELPWEFAPEVGKVEVKVGEAAMVRFRAKNLSRTPLVGTATFNVSPDKAGPYFDKVQCFCFTRQLLQAGEEEFLPVTFFVDPSIVDDPNLSEVRTITLSYTFFRAANQHLDGVARNDYQGQTGTSPGSPAAAQN